MDDTPTHFPPTLSALQAKARDAGFIMSSEDRTGSLLAELQERDDFRCVRLAWASGLLMAVRTT